MAYKCLDCGHIFEEGEIIKVATNIVFGEIHGKPLFDDDDFEECCPLCKGEFEETVKCAICEGEHLEDELFGGVCEECIAEYKYNVEMCYTIGANETESVKLNSFLATMYTQDEIEAILYNDLIEHQKHSPVDCEDFINADKSWFAERLVEEVKKQ